MKQCARRLGVELSRYNTTNSATLRLRLLLAAHGVDLVFDVGAHSGQYGRWLREVGYRGTIISFEPQPEAHARLCAAARNDVRWFVPPPLALGERDGRALLNLAANSESSSLAAMLPAHLAAAPEAAYVGRAEVVVRQLDSLAPALLGNHRVPLLKLDVQGYEGQVLAGAARTLPLLHGLQLEMSLNPLYRGEPTMREQLDRLEALGFVLHSLSPGFSDPHSGRLLQVDGLFFRELDMVSERNFVLGNVGGYAANIAKHNPFCLFSCHTV